MIRSGELARPEKSRGAMALSASKKGKRRGRRDKKRARTVGRTRALLAVPIESERKTIRCHIRAIPRVTCHTLGTVPGGEISSSRRRFDSMRAGFRSSQCQSGRRCIPPHTLVQPILQAESGAWIVARPGHDGWRLSEDGSQGSAIGG